MTAPIKRPLPDLDEWVNGSIAAVADGFRVLNDTLTLRAEGYPSPALFAQYAVLAGVLRAVSEQLTAELKQPGLSEIIEHAYRSMVVVPMVGAKRTTVCVIEPDGRQQS